MFPLLIALCSVHVTRRLRGVGPDVLPPGGVNTHRGVRLGESRVSARPDRLRYDRCKYGRRFSLTPLAPRWLALAPVACRAFRSWLPGGRATGLRYACRTRLCRRIRGLVTRDANLTCCIYVIVMRTGGGSRLTVTIRGLCTSNRMLIECGPSNRMLMRAVQLIIVKVIETYDSRYAGFIDADQCSV